MSVLLREYCGTFTEVLHYFPGVLRRMGMAKHMVDERQIERTG